MPSTSIPKERLVALIVDDLKAVEEATSHFHILAPTSLNDRLMAFTKTELVAFILGLGVEAEDALNGLQSSFPLRRAPTLYLTIIESCPSSEKLRATTKELAKRGRHAGLVLGEDDPIRFLYLPDPSDLVDAGKLKLRELKLHYERRIELIESNPGAANYGEPIATYSLETAIVWIPIEKHKHAVIACCDYPALRCILSYLANHLGMRLNLPWLDTGTLRKITRGAIPRSATFSALTETNDPETIQTITYVDPLLLTKTQYASAIQSSSREQTAGFYINHPGLALGGVGVARRDGKVWTPKRLDRLGLARLALSLLEKAEAELAKIKDVRSLSKHYFWHHAMVGKEQITGKPLSAWHDLLFALIQAERAETHEASISVSLLELLVRYQEKLRLLTAVELECPNCQLRFLARCPICNGVLHLVHRNGVEATCRSCRSIIDSQLECECGQSIEFAQINPHIRILPERELLDSIKEAAVKFNLSFRYVFLIRGDNLKLLPEARTLHVKRILLSDLKKWSVQARIRTRTIRKTDTESLVRILSKTKEKCMRDGKKPSIERCRECNSAPLNPKWIEKGDTCLLRLFGVPIEEQLDGVHHGRELADIKYADTIAHTGRQVRIGVHVKSRRSQPPPQGMGRSEARIKGLYTQVVFSAFVVRERGEKLDVLGIAIPNDVHPDVTESMEFMANASGFPLLIVDESAWLKVVDAAIERTQLEYVEH